MLQTIYFTTSYLQGPAPAPQSWHLDPLSALIGAGIALLLTALAYNFRHELGLGWKIMTAPLLQLRHSLQASAEDRYRELVVAKARSLTVSAHVAPLDKVFIEPKLLAPVPSPSPSSEAELAPTALRELSLRQALRGHPQLAILGEPGTGKTALLAYLALSCALNTSEAQATLGQAQKRLPLYVPLPAMDWDERNEVEDTDESAEEDKPKQAKQEDDPVERLINAALAVVGGKSGLASSLRQYLDTGQAIVLADGWDELAPQQRQQATAWLTELIAALPGNLWLVAAGARGYAPLTETGFVPLTIPSWSVVQVEQFARRWLTVSTPTDGAPPVPARRLIAELQSAARIGLLPLELALLAFVYLADQKIPTGRAKLFDRALELLLWQEQEENDWMLTTCRLALGQLAAQSQEKYALCSRKEIEAAIEAALPPAEELPASATTRTFRALTGERGALHLAGADRYAFVYPLWQAYLTARQLIAIAPTTLIEHLEDPHWADVLRCYAEIGNMGPLVNVWLRTPDDMFYTRLRTLGSWISAAPQDAAWRDGATAVLARAFLKNNIPVRVRQALAESLAVTGVSGVVYLLKQTLQHPDAERRAAAILGLARVAGESDLPALEAALADEAPIVREAAVRGLARLDIDTAIRWLTHVLLEGDDALRLLAADGLAQCGDQGKAILVEAAESEDVLIRRGAIFGLAQIGAQETLEKAAREDEQWIVRSAAAAALDQMEENEKETTAVTPPPDIAQLPWLISWAAAQSEGTGVGEAARRVLLRALSEGDTPVRLNAVQMLTQIGRPDDVAQLRIALTDPEPAIANTALDALAEISRRYDLRIE